MIPCITGKGLAQGSCKTFQGIHLPEVHKSIYSTAQPTELWEEEEKQADDMRNEKKKRNKMESKYKV